MTPGETRDATALIRATVRERGLTLLLIEHDMSVVMGISDRVAVLHFGEKIAEATPEQTRNDPRAFDPYLGGAEDRPVPRPRRPPPRRAPTHLLRCPVARPRR